MSTIKANTIEAADSNTDLVVQGAGSGVPNIETGFKVGGTAGVPTADIRDDAVTGAKLNPALVAGDIIYADGTDTINRLAKGTAAQVLQMNSGATAPEWATAGGGGAWEFVSTQAVTDAASIEVTNLDTDTNYMYAINLLGLVQSAQPIDLVATTGISSGYFADGYVFYLTHTAGGSFSATSGNYNTGWQIANDQASGNNAALGGMLFLFKSPDDQSGVRATGQLLYEVGGDVCQSTFVGHCHEDTGGEHDSPITRFKIAPSSGVFQHGSMTVWAVKNS